MLENRQNPTKHLTFIKANSIFARLPDCPIARLPDCPIARLPDCPIREKSA